MTIPEEGYGWLYPQFGAIPALVAGDLELLVRTNETTVSLAGFFAAENGVTSNLRAVTTDHSLTAKPFGFAQLVPPYSYGTLDIWLSVDDDDLPDHRTYASLISGRRGQNDDIDAASFALWFPFSPAAVQRVVRFVVDWPDAGIRLRTLTCTRDALVDAVHRSIDPPRA